MSARAVAAAGIGSPILAVACLLAVVLGSPMPVAAQDQGKANGCLSGVQTYRLRESIERLESAHGDAPAGIACDRDSEAWPPPCYSFVLSEMERLDQLVRLYGGDGGRRGGGPRAARKGMDGPQRRSSLLRACGWNTAMHPYTDVAALNVVEQCVCTKYVDEANASLGEDSPYRAAP